MLQPLSEFGRGSIAGNVLWVHNGGMGAGVEMLNQRIACIVGLAQRCACAAAAVAIALIGPSQANEGGDLESVVKQAQAYRKTYDGWRAVRQLDCARCHGADYRGNVGPSLIESVQTRDRGFHTFHTGR